MRGDANGVWADDRAVEALQACINDGLTSGQIARRLSAVLRANITRNMVCGKLARLGVHLPRPKKDAPKPRPAPAKTGHKPQPLNRPPSRPMSVIGSEPAPRGDVDDGCRWLHGDDPRARLFCGATLQQQSRFCAHHHSRAFRVEVKR